MNIKTKLNFQLPFEVSGNKQKIKIVIRHVPKVSGKKRGTQQMGYPVFHTHNSLVKLLGGTSVKCVTQTNINEQNKEVLNYFHGTTHTVGKN